MVNSRNKMLTSENIRANIEVLCIRREEIREERGRLFEEEKAIMEEVRELQKALELVGLDGPATPRTCRAALHERLLFGEVGQDDDDKHTPEKQVRFASDVLEPPVLRLGRGAADDSPVPANTPVDDTLHPEGDDLHSSAAAVARNMGSEFEEVFQEAGSDPAEQEATIEEQIKDAFLYCITQNWATQKAGPYMKRKISRILGLGDDSGIEIKTTVTDARGGYNFVQIRPGTHDHLYFCFDPENEEVLVFGLTSDEMKEILPELGSYAHGSIKLLGPITPESISSDREYAIRPNPNDKQTTKNGRAWRYFINNFLLDPNDLPDMINGNTE